MLNQINKPLFVKLSFIEAWDLKSV